ncbi:uncharacterized protein LOC114539576 [Dendronephthya gigantea]|uniref:uncharacterized protein LOC114539576 n=1 Tax=Dendronephthya gigantea TaxID=151771 RepID=UPI00106C06E7|nr:uncharacterized protein LOC114539576 [Dendronephthya gigantea]
MPLRLSFKFDENHDSEHNSMLCSRVSEELAHEYGGAQKCPWSAVLIKEAFKTYFRSSRASNIRSTRGTQKEHVARCKRRNRKNEKLARRLKQLEKACYDAQKTAKFADVMKSEYMSSEESEFDESTENKIVRYNVQKLPWESRALRRMKRKLDKLHNASLSDLVQKRVGEPSTRPKPKDCPEWAALDNAIENNSQSLNSSDTSLNDSFDDTFCESF